VHHERAAAAQADRLGYSLVAAGAGTNNNDNGVGHMEAIYFGNIKVWGYRTGNGP
jgi:Alpha-L-arabinofuranosidase B, catalytic